MLQPKKTKFRRQQKGRMKAKLSVETSCHSDHLYKVIGVQVDYRSSDRSCPYCCNSLHATSGSGLGTYFPNKPITKKPAEVRMGKGKGSPEGFVANVTQGRLIFEIEGVPFDVAKEALRLAAQKLPVTTKFVVRRDYDFQNQNA